MQRVAIIGSCGAGKTTLAKSLGERLDLPVIHLDAHYWQPGWQATDADEWQKIQQKLVKGDRWIIDGNYGSTMDIRLTAADAIVWLDFSRYLCLWRVFKRSLQHFGRVRSDMADGCPERLNWEFLRYVWNFSQLHRPKIVGKLARHQTDKQIIILRNAHQVSNWLKQTM